MIDSAPDQQASAPSADSPVPARKKRRLKTRSIILRVVLAIVIIGILAIVGRWFGAKIVDFETWIQSIGIWGPIVFLLLFIVITGLQIPESLLAVAAGVAFGLTEGLILLVITNIIGAILWFWIARKFLREWVHRILDRHPKLEAIEKATSKEGFRLMVLLRLGPFSYGMLNFMLGASDVRFWPYAFALIAVIPGNLATVYFGSVAKHVAKHAANADNLSDTHYAILIAGFLVTLTVVAIIAHVARNALKKVDVTSDPPAAPVAA